MLIFSTALPAPRLELRWQKTGATWEHRECIYGLVVPLQPHDIRRESKDGSEHENMVVELGRTKVEGGYRYLFQPDTEDGNQIDVPFRTSAHAKWDSESLRLPVYVIYENWAMLLLPREQE